MTWRDSFLAETRKAIEAVDEAADAQWRRFAGRMGFDEARHIATYRGYGNADHAWVRGRLLANKPLRGPREDDNWWKNLSASYQRWESDEVPSADIELQFGDQRRTVCTDEEGYYTARFNVEGQMPSEATVIARHSTPDRDLVGLHRVYFPNASARMMLISDMDDTVIHTGITHLLKAAQLTFLHNARTRTPLPGVSALYRALARGASGETVNPVFYVSNSPWNVFDLLRDFLDLNALPAGPLLLRDLGLRARSANHKAMSIGRILERNPGLPAILVGDSGEHDARIYMEVAQRFHGRIAAIYIRDVDPEAVSNRDRKVSECFEKASELAIPMLLAKDSVDIAQHAIGAGLLPASFLPAIARAVRRDRERPSLASASE